MTDLPVRSFAGENQELAEAFDRYLIARGLSATTRRSYHDSVGRFVELLGSKSLAEADRTDIRALQSSLIAKGLGHSSLDVHTAALRCLFKFLKLAKVTTHDPTLLLAHRKFRRRIPRVLAVSEIEQLIAACDSPLERALIETFYATGMRLSEVCNMRLEDVDFANRVMRVKRGKGNKDRIVLFGTKCAQALREYLGERKTGYLFETALIDDLLICARKKDWRARFWDSEGRRRVVYLGTRAGIADEREARQVFERFRSGTSQPTHQYTVRMLRQVVTRVGARAAIRVHPHALRRAFASHLLQDGADLRAIQELMGHARITTTQIYTGLSVADLKKVHGRCHPHANEANHEEE